VFLHALLQHGLVGLVEQDPAPPVAPRCVVVVKEDIFFAVMSPDQLLLVVVSRVVVVVKVVVGKGATVVGIVLHGVGWSLVPRREAEYGSHLGSVRFCDGLFSLKDAAKNRAEN